ncbi:hypothetical protein H920_02449 [Fukomys damarensis]|uniref:Uncharacterized protein n=1 Tax=Fukomys damarensis TaxID=885580 RepID=A0A091DYV9_FUKDA|nr:hypothetical protein H920_02449 [Fukomys damarensis]
MGTWGPLRKCNVRTGAVCPVRKRGCGVLRRDGAFLKEVDSGESPGAASHSRVRTTMPVVECLESVQDIRADRAAQLKTLTKEDIQSGFRK